jgi:uncharacterized protein (TIGR02271 family)
MATKTATQAAIVGIFAERSDAQRAVSALRQAGFGENEIGMVTQNRDGAVTTRADGDDNNAAEGAAIGAATGVGVGALWALGIAAGMLPAIGPAIAGGLFASILTSAAGAAAVGGLVGALVGLGIPEDEAEFYESEVKAGRTIVTVKTDRNRAAAIDILQQHGASLRGVGADSKGPHFAAQSRVASSESASARMDPHLKDTDACEVSSAEGAYRNRDTSKIMLKKEEVHPRKETHEAGEVRVRKDVVTEHKTFDVPVTKEEVVVERRQVSRKAGSGESVAPNEEIRIPLREEEVRIEKDTVVNEEVSIGKRAVTDTRHVAADAKREELHVEQKGRAVVKDTKAKNPRP